MDKNLVIVESPAKAKTIANFLGEGFTVKSSFGHIRDLKEKDFSIDIDHNYAPIYIVPSDKKKLVAELKKASKDASIVWLASDEDREGEAIAWHLSQELQLPAEKTKRIVFHEITKDAILNAIKNPRDINLHLVDAQQARRVLDRIVGFKASPILWRKIKPSLSAGRVQSVAVRLIVEREREIQNFKPEPSYKVTAIFTKIGEENNIKVKAELQNRFKTKQEAYDFLELCKNAEFTVENIVTKPTKKSPAPPFTTSTLQQEAARKLGYSVSQTMRIAQQLYESGKITYMRTDSVNLSNLAYNTAKKQITETLGEDYLQIRKYKAKTLGAQEAHEAIRPTYIEHSTIEGTAQEQHLYELIWKRTIASQMSDAKFEKTTATISLSNSEKQFVAIGEVLIFDGFLHVYKASDEDENEKNETTAILPPLKSGDKLLRNVVTAEERFSQKPPRYTEPSLVQKMEELGIGRPSTYAPTISTIQKRDYVEKKDIVNEEKNFTLLTLKNNDIKEEEKCKKNSVEKKKLIPTDIGCVVNDFLVQNFSKIMDYNFTANVEKEFDEIAAGKMEWTKSIDTFYKDFVVDVEKAGQKTDKKVGERELGTDPKTGKPVFVKIGRYGAVAQIGAATDKEKPLFAALQSGQSIETITLQEALELFKLPMNIGTFEGETVTIAVGRFGPYIKYGNHFVSIPKGENPLEMTLEHATELILAKRNSDQNREIKKFESEEILVLNGRYGPYISCKKKNFKIPKNIKPETLTLDMCKEIIEKENNKSSAKKR